MSDPKVIPEISPASVVSDEKQAPEKPVKKNGKRNRITAYVVIFFCVWALIAYVIWWFVFRNHETTDDAYVGGNMVVLTSRQMGSVVAYYADDTDFVEQGQLLVGLDPTDYLLAFEQKKSALELAARHVRDQFEAVKQREADVILKKATRHRAWLDYKNRMALVDSEAISQEDFYHARADFQVAKSSLALSEHELEAALAALGTTDLRQHPLIEQAKVDLREAYLALKRCSILAPVSGYIAKRSVQAGQSIKASTPLLSIIPLESIWVDANFKETQLEFIRIGQPVDVWADMYGSDVLFHGRVGGIQGGSGSVFSLLPPQNASGNWIKIVQRVPVRIYLDPEEVKKNPLFLGLSVYVKVYNADTSGPMLAGRLVPKALMETKVFDIPMHELEGVMNSLISANLGLASEAVQP